MHKRQKKISYNEKFLFLGSVIVIIILSVLISHFTDSNFKFNEARKNHKIPYNGSAVRKETHNRQNYEKHYRQKQEKWRSNYDNILNNKEEIRELEKLNLKPPKTKKSSDTTE